jgi:hypothetical protein
MLHALLVLGVVYCSLLLPFGSGSNSEPIGHDVRKTEGPHISYALLPSPFSLLPAVVGRRGSASSWEVSWVASAYFFSEPYVVGTVVVGCSDQLG